MTYPVILEAATRNDELRRQIERISDGRRVQLMDGPVTCLSVGVWFTFDWLSPISLAIYSVTNYRWSHTGLVFWVENAGIHTVTYEAVFPRVIGPLVADDTFGRYLGKPWRRLAIRWLPIADARTRALILSYADVSVRQHTAYDLWQLLRIWAWVRLGRRPPKNDPRAVTCSEFVARALSGIINVDQYVPAMDAVFPGHVYDAVEEYIRHAG